MSTMDLLRSLITVAALAGPTMVPLPLDAMFSLPGCALA